MQDVLESPIDSFRGRYFFLSNFYPCRVEMHGIVYTSVEHAFQAAKTTDSKKRGEIRLAPNAAAAKRLGRSVKLRPGWEEMRVSVMKELLRRKFSEPELQSWLQATRPRVLIEGNTWGDRFWGAILVNRTTPWDGDEAMPCWDGENWLGRLLMEIRDDPDDG